MSYDIIVSDDTILELVKGLWDQPNLVSYKGAPQNMEATHVSLQHDDAHSPSRALGIKLRKRRVW